MTSIATFDSTFPDLRRFFAPRRVALVGATEDLGKFGGRCVRQLLDFGFAGGFHPINPRRSSIFGVPCSASLTELPDVPDHVGIVLPAKSIAPVIDECARMGVPFVTVFSAGFGETGTEAGEVLQSEVVQAARRGGVRFMGPNCNGLINFVDGFALTSTSAISGSRRPAGDVGIVSQSGGAGQVNVMWRAQQAGLGISYQVSCGNDADLDLLDYMAFMVDDPQTKVVLALAERISDGRKLRALAERSFKADKPIVMIKVGRSEAGSRAAASHTGSITGSDAVFDAAMKQLGILRVHDCNELYEAAMLLRRGRHAAGRRVAATSISGGNLVMLADLGGFLGITWPSYSETTAEGLRTLLPGFGVTSNPTDLTAAAIGQHNTFGEAAKMIAADDNVDALIPVLTISPSADIQSIAEVSIGCEKPVAILWTGFASDDPMLSPASLVAQGHAVFRDALPCLRAMSTAMRYGEARARRDCPAPQRPAGMDVAAAKALLSAAGVSLSEAQSKLLLTHYGLSLTREALAADADAAVAHARTIRGPVAMKIQSADIPHKTEANAIRLNVAGDMAVRQAFDAIIGAARAFRPDARIDGIIVQEMVSTGLEMLIGVSRDPIFGPVLTVGFGGIYVEILKDVALRLPPVTPQVAHDMLRELRMYAALTGARGQEPADLDALADCIARVSWLAADLEDELAELDINPVHVLPRGRGIRIIDALAVPRQSRGAGQ